MVRLAPLANPNKGDRVTISNARRSLFRRRSFWVIAVVWAGVLASLRFVWPVQPRLTFHGDVEVLGITSDSRSLLALTQRARWYQDSYLHVSGAPIQIWDLQTGQHSLVCMPGQSCSGELVECSDGIWRVKDQEGWFVVSDRRIRGNQIVFSQGRSANDKTHWQDLLFDSRTESFRLLDQGELSITQGPLTQSMQSLFRLSPSGRWYEDHSRPSGEVRIKHAIRDTQSGEQQVALDGEVLSSCFSTDDACFACALAGKDTRIWNLDSRELVCTIDRPLWGLTFSQDGSLLAGYEKDPKTNRMTKVVICDALTGSVVRQWSPGGLQHDPAEFQSLKFVDHDKRLLCYVPDLINAGAMCQNSAKVNAIWNTAGDIKAEQDLPTFLVPNDGDTFADLGDIYSRNQIELRLQFGIQDQDLCEIPTNKHLLSIPEGNLPLLLTRDGRILVVHEDKMNGLWMLIQQFRIPLPGFLATIIEPRTESWSVIDVPSGRTIATLPAERFDFWLSPDQKSLATISIDSVDGQIEIRVWDFPPRKPILKPLAWSLIIPAISILWSVWRRWRTRTRATV